MGPFVLMLAGAIPLVLIVVMYVYIGRDNTSSSSRNDGRYQQVLARHRPGSGGENALDRGASEIYGDNTYSESTYGESAYGESAYGDSAYGDDIYDESYTDDTYEDDTSQGG